MLFRRLPWEYAVRNLFRRPLRTGLTFVGLTTVILMVFVVVGFIRGLTKSLVVSGDKNTAVVYSQGMGANLEYSSIAMRTSDLVPASVPGVAVRYGKKAVSPELYLGTEIGFPDREGDARDVKSLGLVRGVTPGVLLVRRRVELETGDWPQLGEVIVGRLAATKLGVREEELTVGSSIEMEGRAWRVSGVFSSAGSAFESEIWCDLQELQQAMKRQDLSLVALAWGPDGESANLEEFCQDRLDLELQAMSEDNYYAALQKDYAPIMYLSWLVVALVAGAGVLAGLNTMYGAVIGRIRELSTLQTIGFGRTAILLSLLQEGLLLAAAASLTATGLSLLLINGAAIRFTMGAFHLQIDNVAILIGCGVGFLLGLLGTIPAAIRGLRKPIVEGLKSA
ncbi:MAG: ABC transporter permease [Pirellulales bacterium]|nr:ABC transporter permease [Pirellulales bacterium]